MRKRIISRLMKIFGGRHSSPSSGLIRQTAIEQWRLIALSFFSAMVGALGEGVTLAIVFIAVDVLTSNRSVVALPIPGIDPWVIPLSGSWLVGFLLLLALIAQAIQSFMRYVNTLSTSYFGARCFSRVAALVHRQILSFGFLALVITR